MTCRGVVKNGKVELESGVELPEGAPVRVEVLESALESELDAFAREVAEACEAGPSLVGTLHQMRDESDAR